MQTAPNITTPDEVIRPRVEEVSEGVFAYLQLYGQWGLNNAGFIAADKRTIAIDTCFTVPRGQAFREAIATTTGKPCTTLLNTHHHGDHTFGNFLFPEATVIAHRLCRHEVLEQGLSTVEMFQDGVDWGDVQIEAPFVTYDDHLTVYADDLRIDAYYMGPAHTTNDTILYLPERKVMYAGDLAFAGGTPFVLMGSVTGSLAAYERLRNFDVETVVPGHGPICGPEVFEDMAAYLRWLLDIAQDAHSSGVSALEAARESDLGKYADWHDAERLAGNLHRAMAELGGIVAGGPIDISAAVADMRELNGGYPMHCLA